MTDNVRRRAVQVEMLDAPEGEGRARALVTTFDREYGIGPRTTETITRSTFADGPVPIYFQHGHSEVPVGHAMATAAERGTELDVQFYLDTERGLATYRAMTAGALKEWSVGFTAGPDDITVTRGADGSVNERIDRGDLLEVSVVLRGANPNTETLEVRSETEVLEAPAEPEAPAVETAPIPIEMLDRIGESHIRDILRDLVH